MLALAAFVAGIAVLQQFSRLPSHAALLACGAGAGALLALACGARCLAACAPPAQRHGPLARALRGAVHLAVPAAALAGFCHAGLQAQGRLADELAFADEGRELRIQGVVASLPAAVEGGTRFTFDVDPGPPGSVAVPRRLALSWYQPPPAVLPAQRWELSVRLRRPQGPMNPGGFDAEAWMLEQGIRAVGSVRAGAHDPPPRLLEDLVWRWNPCIDRARAALRDMLLRLLAGRRHASVIVALVMGDQGAITEEDWALFNRTGISHLVSISGLHITMIAALAALAAGAAWRRVPFLLRRAGVPTVRALAAIAGGLAYCLLAGWGIPAQRTLLMLSAVALAQCLRLRLPAATLLAGAAALVCLWDPWAVLAAGFWLSFGAVACIFLNDSGRVAAAAAWRDRLRAGLRIQAAITIGQIPLTLAIFGQVSFVAPVANALAIPLVSYVVAPLALAGTALCLLGTWGVTAGAGLLHGAEAVFGWLAQVLQWLTLPAWSWIALPAPPPWTIGLAVLGCAWLLAPAGWPARGAGACWLVPMFCWPAAHPAPGALWVTALDVGQGMAIVLESADAVVVFDTGPRYSAEADAGGRVLVPYLRARGITRIDALVVSHQDIDHAGGAASVLRSLSVDRVWTSVEPGHRLLAGAHDVRRCEAGQGLALGSLSLQVLSPPAALYAKPRASTNARSCVILVRQGDAGVLLTGDVPARQEQDLVGRWPDVAAGLLVAPHHGSHSSSSEALIAAVRPRWVSMQLGYRNHFGHPHPEVVQRYREHGVVIVRSDESGAAQWRFEPGGPVALERWRVDHARYWHNRPPDGGTPGWPRDAARAAVTPASPALETTKDGDD